MANSSTSLKSRITKNFIYDAFHKLTSEIKTLFEKLNITKKSDLDFEDNPTLYQMFLDWLLEVTSYGIILSILVNYFHNFEGVHILYSWIIYGLLRWFILDSIENIRKKI